MSCQRKVLVYLLLGACFMLSSEESSPELIPFSFEKKQLIMIIDDIAHRLQINIIPPQSAADLDTLRQQRVSYRSLTPLIPAKDALNLLMTFLELSGFSLIRKKEVPIPSLEIGLLKVELQLEIQYLCMSIMHHYLNRMNELPSFIS